MTIRTARPDEDWESLTLLIRSAYAYWAERNQKFVATTQDAEETRKRATSGTCFLAEIDGKIVGTLTVYPSDPEDYCPYYRNPQVAAFGQFAVDPACQGKGIGTKLIEAAEDYARATGHTELALDTSENAQILIDYYNRLGFQVVGDMDWHSTNYHSVVMSKVLTDEQRPLQI